MGMSKSAPPNMIMLWTVPYKAQSLSLFRMKHPQAGFEHITKSLQVRSLTTVPCGCSISWYQCIYNTNRFLLSQNRAATYTKTAICTWTEESYAYYIKLKTVLALLLPYLRLKRWWSCTCQGITSNNLPEAGGCSLLCHCKHNDRMHYSSTPLHCKNCSRYKSELYTLAHVAILFIGFPLSIVSNLSSGPMIDWVTTLEQKPMIQGINAAIYDSVGGRVIICWYSMCQKVLACTHLPLLL